jgi:hypothetical protein
MQLQDLKNHFNFNEEIIDPNLYYEGTGVKINHDFDWNKLHHKTKGKYFVVVLPNNLNGVSIQYVKDEEELEFIELYTLTDYCVFRTNSSLDEALEFFKKVSKIK